MLIPIGSVHDARVVASTIRELTCTRCRRPFYFSLERTGKGRATTDFFVGMKQADQEAARKARASLEKQLASDVEPVSCPRCGFYQAQMVATARRRLYPWPKIVGLWALAHYGLGYLLYLAFPSASLLLLSVPGLTSLAYLLLQRTRFDPNQSPKAAVRLRTRFPCRAFPSADAAAAALQPPLPTEVPGA